MARTKETTRIIMTVNDSIIESTQKRRPKRKLKDAIEPSSKDATEPKLKKIKIAENVQVIQLLDLSQDKQELVFEIVNLEERVINAQNKQFEVNIIFRSCFCCLLTQRMVIIFVL